MLITFCVTGNKKKGSSFALGIQELAVAKNRSNKKQPKVLALALARVAKKIFKKKSNYTLAPQVQAQAHASVQK